MKRVKVEGIERGEVADEIGLCLWARRASSVVTSEMPTLPPMLRARLMSPVALFVRSFGTNEKAVTLMGTNGRRALPGKWSTQRQTSRNLL